MWLSRAEYERLRAIEAAQAVTKTVHTRELREVVRRMRSAERRASEAESALSLERHDSQRTIRHLINCLLRAKEIGAYPVPATEPAAAAQPVYTAPAEQLDEGEIEALLAAGAGMGVTRADVVALLKKEKGLD